MLNHSTKLMQKLMQAPDGPKAGAGGPAAGIHIQYPAVATGPYEQVLVFSTKEFIQLKLGPTPYFTSKGTIVDLNGRDVPGSLVATTLPVDLSRFPEAFQWPPTQVPPFDQPPIQSGNTVPIGDSRQAYFFNNQADSLITIGPAVPKIAVPLLGGAGQFWVSAVGVITQGTGKYAGARGEQAYVGSSFINPWPATQEQLIQGLTAGINVQSTSVFKLVLQASQLPAPPPGP